MSNDIFEELGEELDAESWEWLVESQPRIADAVEKAVALGAKPHEVRAYVLRRCGSHREELARRCELASRYLSRKVDA